MSVKMAEPLSAILKSEFIPNAAARSDHTCKRIYLDTNHWIKLLAIEQGKEKDEQLRKIFTAIKKLTKSNKIRVLFSAYTLSEIWKHSDKKKQDKLIDLIVDISQGYVLKPSISFREKEIENAALAVLGEKYIHDVRSEIMGRGLADICDMSFEKMNEEHPKEWNLLKNNLPGLSEDFFKKDFQNFNENPDIIKKNLKNMERTKPDILDNILKGIEEDRLNNSKMSKEMFSKYLQARYFADDLVPHLTRFFLSRKINPRKTFADNKDIMPLLWKHLHSINVFFILCLRRDSSAQKPISSHDAYDIAHLSGAIPYCDVVVTEKMFTHISTKNKLDQIYHCDILDDLRSLSEIEPIKSKIQRLDVI